MCITNPLKISDFQGNLLHMLLFLQKHAFYFSILRIKEGLSHVQQPLFCCYFLTSLCEGGGPAGPVGESFAAALTISGDHKVLSPTVCGRSPLAEGPGDRGNGQMRFTAALPAWPRHRRGCARTSRGRRPRGPGWLGQHRRGAARPAGKHCRPWRGTPCSA